jgi:hypothetical protein
MMAPDEPQGVTRLGPVGPFPDAPMRHPLERRWLHYAFSSERLGLSMIANLSTLTPEGDHEPQEMRVLLVHDRSSGWHSSQFNADAPAQPWSAFRAGQPPGRFTLAARAGVPGVDFALTRTSRPCTSQCAPFAGDQHLRWQSESGVLAEGTWITSAGRIEGIPAFGYHERVRGLWGWPELGGWVFGFANDQSVVEADPGRPPPYAVVFTLIQPPAPPGASTGSVMLWHDGRLRRHFPRRRISVAVQGTLDRDAVVQVPPLARLLGVGPTASVPARLVVSAATGSDRLVLEVAARTAARIVNPSETSFRPFSVHEVIGDCRVEGTLGGERFAFTTEAIVEFAGGASG